jgi:hypothetical protein
MLIEDSSHTAWTKSAHQTGSRYHLHQHQQQDSGVQHCCMRALDLIPVFLTIMSMIVD